MWISNQWIIPPGGTTANGSLAAYWNPLAGCGGKPDPHGDCLLQDTNNTSGHGEWRDGGEAVATNVPAWAKADYRLADGLPDRGRMLFPRSCNLPFAERDAGHRPPDVNYTNANPPFAGVSGVPWGFDAGAHPNAAGANAPAEEAIRAFDNHSGARRRFRPDLQRVAGQLYVATPALVAGPGRYIRIGGRGVHQS